MNLWELLQAVVLLVVGAVITFVATVLTARRSAKLDAALRRAEHDREDQLRREAREIELEQSRWEAGREHALSAIALLRPVLDQWMAQKRDLWAFRLSKETVSGVLSHVAFLPDETLRSNLDTCLRLISYDRDSWPPKGVPAWTGFVLTGALDNLTRFVRREPLEMGMLQHIHDAAEGYWDEREADINSGR